MAPLCKGGRCTIAEAMVHRGDCTAGTDAHRKSNVERYFLFAQPDTNMQHFTAQSLSQLR